MSERANITINKAQKSFLDKHGLSASKITQDAINKLAQETDEKEFQSNILDYESKKANHQSKWYRAMEYYNNDFNKKKIVMLLFTHALGFNIDEGVKKMLEEKEMTIEEFKEVENTINKFKTSMR